MRYKIGDIAAQFGVSTQTVRNYEQSRFLAPERRKGSTTREYDPVSVKRVGNLRRFLSYGFSMEEVRALFSYTEPEQFMAAFEGRIADTKEQIIRQMLLVEAMERRIADLQLIGALLDRCRIETCPKTLFLVTRRGEELLRSSAVTEWTALLPFVGDGRCGEFAAGGHIGRGYSISADAAGELGLSAEPPVHVYEETPCAHTVVWEQSPQPPEAGLAAALLHIGHQGLRPRGEWFGRCLMVSQEALGVKQPTPGGLYYEFWIPVINK
ncbi:MAG TPA: MerR family transcriptional regulator [Terriglobales bacterium]|nr:MerR family transcriptional regulator [Terriglobales bacterium]